VAVAHDNSARERHWTCARQLRERRRQLGLTQVDVVDRLRRRGTELTNRTLSAMENGRGLDLGILPDLAAVLDCSITFLLGLAADPAAWQPDPPLGAAAAAVESSADSRMSAEAQSAARPDDAADREATACPWILGPDIPDSPPRVGPARRVAPV